jgi:hypothetical protein
VVPNIADAGQSQLVFNDVVQNEAAEVVTLDIFDLYKNRVIEEQPIVLSIKGQGQEIFSTYVV